MPTVDDILTQAISTLTAAGVDSPRLDAEVLLAQVLGRSRGWLWAHREYMLTAGEEARFTALLDRRAQREPLAYLLGEWEFYGRPFTVSPAVLVPRPETELLVEAVLAWARAHGARRLADIGTGSGAVAVTLAAEAPELALFAIDLSPDALAVAHENADRHGVGERITFLQGDLLAPLHAGGYVPLDAIVANLPYVDIEARPVLMPEVRDYEPALALFADDGGLALVRRLLIDAAGALRPGGMLALELGLGQPPRVAAWLQAAGWQAVRVIDDYAGIARHVLAEHGPPASLPAG